MAVLAVVAGVVLGGGPAVEAQTAHGYLVGTVLDEAGQPAMMAAVTAHPVPSGSPLHTYTDHEGRYSFSLPAGEWQIEFETATRTRGLYENEWYEDRPDRASAHILVVEPYLPDAAVTRADATLTPNGRIWGRVSSVDEAALADVCVDLIFFDTVTATSRTGADGMYEFTQLKPFFGYTLAFADCDPSINRIKSETREPSIYLTVGSMQQQVDHRVTLESVISGRVVNTDGAPVPDMCAELGLSSTIPAPYYPYRIERTDADGRFVFNSLDLRTTYYWRVYDCNADNRQYFPGVRHQTYLWSEGEDYEAPDEVLLRYSSISGRVTDTHGNPIGGIKVWARSSRTSPSAITASDGTYTVDRLLPIAGYTVTFDCYLYCPYAAYEYPEEISIPVDNTHLTGIDAVLYQPARIYGSVRDESGSGITAIQVYLYREGELVKRGSTNYGGAISWAYGTELEPGDYTVHFVDGGWCKYWYIGCREWWREPNTFQDHWYQRQYDQQSATVLHLEGGEYVTLGVTMLPWGEYFNEAPDTPVDVDGTANQIPETAAAGDLVGITVSASDPDGDVVTYSLLEDAGGRFAIDDASGVVTVADGSLLDGLAASTITVVASDGQMTSSADFEITVLNVAPVVTVSDADGSVDDATVSVQYSDPLPPVTITATDVTGDRLDATATWSVDGGPHGSGLPDAGTLTGSVALVGATEQTSPATWTLAGIADLAPGSYTVRVTVTDDDAGSTAVDITIQVAPEDATVTFDASNPVAEQVIEPGGASGAFDVGVWLTDLDDGDRGDIDLATLLVTLAPVGPGSSVPGTCAYAGEGIWTCSFDGVPVNTYTVVAEAGGFYAGTGEDVLVVFDPSLGFTTGGGTYVDANGDRVNFGYTMKYNRRGTNVQGSLLVIRHVEEGVYRLKSNQVDGLALGAVDDYGWASFTGKATYKEPGWEDAVGNYEFVAYVEDRGTPGTGADRFWLTAGRAGDSAGGLSLEAEAMANAILLTGGNIVVPH